MYLLDKPICGTFCIYIGRYQNGIDHVKTLWQEKIGPFWLLSSDFISDYIQNTSTHIRH